MVNINSIIGYLAWATLFSSSPVFDVFHPRLPSETASVIFPSNDIRPAKSNETGETMDSCAAEAPGVMLKARRTIPTLPPAVDQAESATRPTWS